MHVISFYKTNSVCGRQYNLVNKTFLRLPASLIQHLVFHLWWNLIFLPKLYMTSEEEGGAKPSLSSNYTENHIISLPLSLHGLPATVLLVDSVCLCHSREQACILNESWRRDWRRLRERGGEWRAWTCRGNTTETPSWVLPAPPDPLTELTDRGKIFFHLWDQVLY